ncbi:MAG: aKG-HExxH-type peptide beta-hydroxylase [Acidimicrobiales bacterium]
MTDLDGAVAVLSWDERRQAPSFDARDGIMFRTARSLAGSLAADRGGAAAGATETLAALPDDGFRNLLSSPRVRELVWATPDVTELASLVMREGARCGLDVEAAAGWSALGDTWVGDAPAGLVHGSPGGAVGPIAVDVSLPTAVERPSGGLRDPVAPSGPDLERSRSKAGAALRTAARVSPAAHAFVCCHTSTVVFRHDRAGDPSVRSASSAAAPGRTMLVNVDDDAADRQVAEALLHEAIHAFVTALEFRGPLTDDGGSRPVRSPWTGDRIPGRALAHACFVWFGLDRFRRLAGDDTADPNRAVADGFRRLDLDVFDQAGVALSEPCRQALELMKELVLDGRWQPDAARTNTT